MNFSYLISMIPDAGISFVCAAFLAAIYFHLRKTNLKDNSEGAVYELLTKEIIRLNNESKESRKLIIELKVEADEEKDRCASRLEELRKECELERAKSDETIADLSNRVQHLTDKLIGD